MTDHAMTAQEPDRQTGIDIVERLRANQRTTNLGVSAGDLVREAADEITRLRAEVATLKASNQQAWRERNHAVAKVKAWEQTLVCEGLPLRSHRVDEWGPDEGEQVTVPSLTPRKLTDILDELATLKASIADEREDAARAMREACANAGYTVCAENRHVTLGDKVHGGIRNLNPATFRERQP